MPTYEYKCSKCLKKSSRFFRSISQVTQVVLCAHCGSSNLTRVFSTFAIHSPWDSGINIPSYETMSDVNDDDPKSVARWAKGMRQDMGDNFGRQKGKVAKVSDLLRKNVGISDLRHIFVEKDRGNERISVSQTQKKINSSKYI